MKILQASRFTVGIPFRESIAHQLKARRQTASLVVKLFTAAGVSGYGEGAPRAYVTGETLPGLVAAADRVLPTLAGKTFGSVAEISKYTHAVRLAHGPALACALEIALLDALGQEKGCSLAEFLPAPTGQALTYSAVLPFLPAEKMPQWLELIRGLQLPTLKVKVGREDDVERLGMVREVLGPAIDIRLDANRAWCTAEALGRIEALLPFAPTWIEEPLRPEDLTDLPALANHCPLPVLLDESVTSLPEAMTYAEQVTPGQLCFNLKLSKLGGLLAASAIQQFAEKNGIACQLGCHVGETAILTAAGRHFARAHRLHYLEGGYAPFFMADDLTAGPVSFAPGGKLQPLTGPGLGITPELQKLVRYDAAHSTLLTPENA